MRAPVLLIVFNRPDLARRALADIAAARPPRLYVAGDGPRHPGEAAAVAAARAAATAVSWPCAVHTRFQPANLGVTRGCEAALDWFFTAEDAGIVIEDDMAPRPSFFAFADALLDRYPDDPRVGIVSGLTLLPPAPGPSWRFSNYFHMWGWATWARVWRLHDPTLADWPRARADGLLARVLAARPHGVRHWSRAFDRAHQGRGRVWDDTLQFALWRHGLVSVVPAVPMVGNRGFGAGATHSLGPMPARLRRAVPRDPAWPLTAPAGVTADPLFDARIERQALGIGPASEAAAAARTLLGPAWPPLRRALRTFI